jgi:hypothetical protein
VLDWKSITIYIERRKGVNSFDKTPEALAQEGKKERGVMKKMKMDKIAKRLGAERRGKISATGGYFGAAQLAEEVATRFQVPAGGGRSTDPSWDKKRLVPLASDTLKSLEKLAKEISRDLRR